MILFALRFCLSNDYHSVALGNRSVVDPFGTRSLLARYAEEKPGQQACFSKTYRNIYVVISFVEEHRLARPMTTTTIQLRMKSREGYCCPAEGYRHFKRSGKPFA
uniref:Uncharacterized protein n=1 Tax=Candidatus Kentrum sp. MB TaxID=2138164 RepID=A0A450Y2E4_9GAMM|nr:MAG: hypothetical protein BECKMB1821G_GA0114241_11336 [Candidatus Kentron sp. MB]VFK35710.1 MAG: hypothetical protein BECKMB1821I_GA0114274_11392 [Candidatus Kentron sp. MB]VFK77453.1 MAG: hypothetical protein BECKMB1821H_GA0114242_11415 [Candidatus Kentron sp. MB]